MATYSEAPPALNHPRRPVGLSIVTGFAGLCVAVGAAPAGFLERYVQVGEVGFPWAATMQIAFVAATIGAVLSFAVHDIGPPMVVGASAVVLAVVGTVAIGDLKVSDLLDDFPVRGGVFYGGGGAALVAVVLGLMCLRGQPQRALGVGIALFAVTMVVAVAALIRVDDDHGSRALKLLLGFVVIAVVTIAGAFVGRYGAVVGATASAILIPAFVNLLDFDVARQWAAQLAVAANVGILLLSLIAVVVASHQPALAYRSPQPFEPEPTVESQPRDSVPSEPVPTEPFQTDVEPAMVVADPDEITEPWESPVGAITSATAVTAAATGQPAVSHVGQWAPDPYGHHQLRYWDGEHWTEHISTNGARGLDPV